MHVSAVGTEKGLAYKESSKQIQCGDERFHARHLRRRARAAVFYGNALGFDRMVWRYPGALFLGAGGYRHHLGVNSWAQGAPAPHADDARLLE